MKHLHWLVLASLLAGCSSDSGLRHWSDEFADQPDLDLRPLDGNLGEDLLKETSHLGTDKIKSASKTIAYAPGGTEEGTTWMAGAVRADRIDRLDANDHCGARVTLFNTTDAAITVEWKFGFLTSEGRRATGLNEDWKSIHLEPHAWEVVYDSSRIRGTVSFLLAVRKAATTDEGLPDRK